LASEPLEIRLLGDLEVRRAGRVVALPASKKSRGLLAYLVATGRPHLRQHVCDLLFEGPDDPRASLRWSLTKIRPLVDDPACVRLQADRERVAFAPEGARVDVVQVREALAGGPEAASTAVLQAAAELFRGELLEGLDLHDCYRYQEWCVAEREAARALHLTLLETLVRRLQGNPEEALRHARARLAVDPVGEAGHVAVVRLLGGLGRTREALRQYEACCRILESEWGARPSAALEEARRSLGKTGAAWVAASPEPLAVPEDRVPLVGRQAERAALASLVAAASAGTASGVLLVQGEAGIGKSRLLDELAQMVRAAGGRVLTGRAFEAEMVRPYGAWVDALRSVPKEAVGEGLRADLGSLLPDLGPVAIGAADRNRLFDAVVALLTGLTADASPLALLLDDIHWCDEAAAALLHFVARGLPGSRVLLAVAARPGELADNHAVSHLVSALGREGRLRTLDLPSLSREEIEALARGVDPTVDVARVAAECDGNPLFALELARALRGGDPRSETLSGLIDDRLARLDDRGRELLPWAAALGRSFDLDTLGAVAGLVPGELLAAVGGLEQRGIVRADPAGRGYDFVHDLVRRSAYQRLSEPQRRLVHRHIAAVLEAMPDGEEALAGEIAHHAALGGDPERAARAAIRAGERCLRLFAQAEAAELAERGIRQVQGLPRETRLRLHLELLKVYVHSGAGRDKVRDLEAEVSRLTLEAQDAGMHALVQTGFYLNSFLHYHGGDFAQAHQATLRAAEAGRSADPATAARALANTARCLSLLQRDMPRAALLLREAESRAREVGLEVLDVQWGLGLVHHHSGAHEAASVALEQAVGIARREGDHWSECDCLSRLALIALEEERPRDALDRCRELAPVAAKMGEGSEAPLAAALEALSRLALGEAGADGAVEAAVTRLREIDSRWLVACCSNRGAEIDLAAGRMEAAVRRAREALAAAEAVGRRSEVVLARALLARTAAATGDRPAAAGHLQALRADLVTPGALSSHALAAVARAASDLGVPIPTPAPTLPTTAPS
jgi:DNA-binding SARP family transcriptional activator/tetratricopeptide (TPR) repeat protein